MRTLLLGAAASIALGSIANATTPQSWYFGLEGGGSWVDDVDVVSTFDPGLPGPPGGSAVVTTSQAEFDRGWAALATVGYAITDKWRVEIEGGYRVNEVDASPGVELSEWSAMANLLYDIHLSRAATFSLGAGAGADYAMFESSLIAFDEAEWNFAYQGIAGFSYALSNHVDLTLTYRYLRVMEPELTGPATGPAGTQTFALDDVVKHTASVGLRYSFGATAPEPVAAPPPPPPPPAEPALAREFIVFFGHNRSDLTPEALDVVRQAAAAAKSYGGATITVVGHADRSGSAAHNQKLSLRRGDTVKGALVGEGIAAGAISVSGKGEGDPMVATADGVREPQNRRVHITL